MNYAITRSKTNGLFLFQNISLLAQFWNKAPQTFEYSVTLNISAQYIGYCSNIFSSKIMSTVQDPTLKDRPVVNQRQTILIRKHISSASCIIYINSLLSEFKLDFKAIIFWGLKAFFLSRLP